MEAAAEKAQTDVSEFIRRRALEAVELDRLDRRIFTLPAEDWEAFENWLNAPPKANPALQRLLSMRPPWEDT